MHLPAGFWDRVNRRGKCWVWTGYLSKGYGRIYIQGVPHLTHRLVLQWFTQKEGEGLEASHGPCHNCACVHPLHLSWKTHAENMADMARDRSLPRGERNGTTLLTRAKVRAIRRDTRFQYVIAESHGVTQSTVSHIKNSHTWAWLE